MEKKVFFALMIVSVFLVSACQIYDTLYVNQAGMNAEKISDKDIALADDSGAGKNVSETKQEVVEVGKDASENLNVVLVKETDAIGLIPKAEDPDKDNLDFTFTSPFDKSGEWQTTYGDAGEYTITVTASDGQLTTSKEVLVIVKKKEEAPVFESFMPEQTAVVVDETDALSFEVKVSDLNNDPLKYVWKLDGVEISDKSSLEYGTTYDDAGAHTMKIIVSDGVFDTEKIWSITVGNVNRKPKLAAIDSISAKETDTVTITADAIDEDNDDLVFSIDDSRFKQEAGTFTWTTGYEDADEHTVTVSASDGVDTVSQQVGIKVENVNRAPVILDIIQK